MRFNSIPLDWIELDSFHLPYYLFIYFNLGPLVISLIIDAIK